MKERYAKAVKLASIEKMTKDGEKILKYQAYRCLNNHFFSQKSSLNKFTNSFIEYVVIVYLYSLSINTTIDLIRIYFKKDILTKETVLSSIEVVADKLPTLDDIDRLYHPKRSVYMALDEM